MYSFNTIKLHTVYACEIHLYYYIKYMWKHYICAVQYMYSVRLARDFYSAVIS